MKTERTATHRNQLLLVFAALFCALPAFSWEPSAVDGFDFTAAQAPRPAYPYSGNVALPGMTPQPNAPWGESPRNWYGPVEGRDGRAFVESLPVGTFRPLKSAPPPGEWDYKGYNFRPLGPASGLSRAPAGSRRRTTPLSTGARIGLNRQLPDAEWHSNYRRRSPHFNFRPDRQPERQQSMGYNPP